MTTLIRMRELSRVFASPSGFTLHAHIARLAVLYEDLRIELIAIAQASIPVPDITDERYRRNYFLRRSIATLVEFAETLRLLDKCTEFQGVKARFGTEIAMYWPKALRFFDKHEALLESVRNDIGGHFGQKAAIYAKDNLDPTAVGKIEAKYMETIHLHFAGEIAASAALRHLPGSTAKKRFENLLTRRSRNQTGSWTFPKMPSHLRKHWSKTASPEISCQKKQAFMYTGTKKSGFQCDEIFL